MVNWITIYLVVQKEIQQIGFFIRNWLEWIANFTNGKKRWRNLVFGKNEIPCYFSIFILSMTKDRIKSFMLLSACAAIILIAFLISIEHSKVIRALFSFWGISVVNFLSICDLFHINIIEVLIKIFCILARIIDSSKSSFHCLLKYSSTVDWCLTASQQKDSL